MTDIETDADQGRIVPPTNDALFRIFGKIGLLSFGGPAAQIALMHRVLVDEMRWLSERQYLSALNFCMLLPGPEAMQLATYAGWRMRGVAGGLLAGLLFVLPGAAVIALLATLYVSFGAMAWMQALFLGVKAAVLVIVIEALLKVSKRALKSTMAWLIAASAFVAIFFLSTPFPLIIIAAGIIGAWFLKGQQEEPQVPASVSIKDTARTVLIWLAIWWAPVLLAFALNAEFITALALFFSKLAVVTFGGAYAVLAYMTQAVVVDFGWLSAGEMMDALGLAETTPGPLILVTEFVGFLAGFEEDGMGLALLAAMMTLWVTFAPCFLWIFAGAPYLAWISGQPRLTSALSAITAAVVGVMLNLSIWFALHVVFEQVTQHQFGVLTIWLPEFQSIDLRVILLTALAGVMLLYFRLGLAWVLPVSGLAGLLVTQWM